MGRDLWINGEIINCDGPLYKTQTRLSGEYTQESLKEDIKKLIDEGNDGMVVAGIILKETSDYFDYTSNYIYQQRYVKTGNYYFRNLEDFNDSWSYSTQLKNDVRKKFDKYITKERLQKYYDEDFKDKPETNKEGVKDFDTFMDNWHKYPIIYNEVHDKYEYNYLLDDVNWGTPNNVELEEYYDEHIDKWKKDFKKWAHENPISEPTVEIGYY